MPVGFTATEFAVVRDNGVLVTTLSAASTEEDDLYLMLQHKAEISEQDEAFGMHLPYIEYCGQGWSWYGHILEFSLRRGGVKVQLDAEAAQHMHGDGDIEVQFDLSDAQFEVLKSAFQETFAGYAYYRVVA